MIRWPASCRAVSAGPDAVGAGDAGVLVVGAGPGVATCEGRSGAPVAAALPPEVDRTADRENARTATTEPATVTATAHTTTTSRNLLTIGHIPTTTSAQPGYRRAGRCPAP